MEKAYSITEENIKAISDLLEYREWWNIPHAIMEECNLPTDISVLPVKVQSMVENMIEFYDNDFGSQHDEIIYADKNKVIVSNREGLALCSKHGGWEWRSIDENEFIFAVISEKLSSPWFSL